MKTFSDFTPRVFIPSSASVTPLAVTPSENQRAADLVVDVEGAVLRIVIVIVVVRLRFGGGRVAAGAHFGEQAARLRSRPGAA
jgi:hypothetical protein